MPVRVADGAGEGGVMKQPPPPAVRMALAILLNHVQPGYDNCKAVVRLWLDGKIDEPEPEEPKP